MASADQGLQFQNEIQCLLDTENYEVPLQNMKSTFDLILKTQAPGVDPKKRFVHRKNE